MAGGKETPRQKMIGMMYLVLTALLALNVSKSILDAFVAIEENTQEANIVQYDRAEGFKADIKSEISTTKGPENKAKLQKLKQVQSKMEEIDKETAKMIKFIDELKLELLEKSGEDISKVDPNNEEVIVWQKYDSKEPCKPMRLNLAAVQAKDQYDVPMHVLIGENIKKPTGKGMKLWNDFNNYRVRLVEMIGTYEWGGKKFDFKAKHINDFKDFKDLLKKVEKMVDENKKANLKEDRQVLIETYMGLTKKERSKVHDVKDVHWIGKTFDHAPLVAAIASLSSLQQDILSARALALAHWKSKVSTGEYSFNKIVGLAYGPEVANTGDSVTIQVMMAAFDSDNQPQVKVTEGPEGVKVVYPGNGQGLVQFRVGSATQTIKGTVTIKNKSGVPKTENWEKEIIVMKPSGSIELPELNVLYRGYPNKVNATASGYDQTVLGGTGVSISKSGDGWIAKPVGRSRKAYLTVTGKNSATGQSKQLKKVEYRVSNLPDPEIYWGAAKSGQKGSKYETKLFAKYPPEIPLNATFRIKSWECVIPGAPGRPPMGSGSNVAGATRLIKQAKPGTTITFVCKVIGPDGITRTRVGAFKI